MYRNLEEIGYSGWKVKAVSILRDIKAIFGKLRS